MLPGVSRSGSTIFGGVAARLDRETAAKFSFMMSAPAIVGGLVSEGMDVLKEGVNIGPDLPAILVGMAVAGVSGYLAIRFFLRLISRVSLNGFAIYVAVLGILVIILQAMGVITDAPAPVAEVAAAAKAVRGCRRAAPPTSATISGGRHMARRRFAVRLLINPFREVGGP